MNSPQRFEKTAACPTNETLLAYQRGTERDRQAVATHLAACEFCALLVEALRTHPPDQSPPVPPPVPDEFRRTMRRQLRSLKRCQ